MTEPLLYIEQPTIEKPKAFMQEYYYDTKTKELPEEEKKIGEDSSENGVGSFKDLSIDKKISYLLDLPEGFPQIRCEFITKEKSYRGILLERVDNVLTIRVLGKKERVKVKVDELTNIVMLGF